MPNMSWRASLLRLAAWSKFKRLQEWSGRRVVAGLKPVAIPEGSTRLVFGGDINFDPTIRRMWNLGLFRVRSNNGQRSFSEKVRRKLWRKWVQPMLSSDYSSIVIDQPFDELSVGKPAKELHQVVDHFAESTRPAEVDWSTVASDWDFPFKRISSFLRKKDLVVMNLETPLSDLPRAQGLFKSDPRYAAAIKRAGIGVVNLSNNHIFDAGEQGFYDTLKHLDAAGVVSLGTGKNLEHARRGTVLEKNGTGFALLAYTQFCNSRFASLATDQPGILPLDRRMMIEDIKRAKNTADLVIVSLHWGIENQPNVHPAQVDLAHVLADAGADCIIGHHPHVAHGIEVYRGCPIVYSLGNFIFAQRNHPSWIHNFICELIVADKKLAGLLVRPIASRGGALFQPALLEGAENVAALNRLQIQSLPFGTQMAAAEGAGYLPIHAAEGRCAPVEEAQRSVTTAV